MQALHRDNRLLAYHDIADGGLLVACVEMAFAARCGLAITLDGVTGDPLATLFAEELGAVVQVRAADRDAVLARVASAGLVVHAIGAPTAGHRVRITRGGMMLIDEARTDLHRAWSATTRAMQKLRATTLEAADQEYARILDIDDPGLAPDLTFDPNDDIAAPFIATGIRPRVAILREQGVNGHVEMAAAFDRAGFDAYDVHMSDITRRAPHAAGIRGIRRLRRLFLRRRASARGRARRKRYCTTTTRATSSRRSSSAARVSRWVYAMAAR